MKTETPAADLISVFIGTSAHASEERCAEAAAVICRAYGYMRVSQHEVKQRLCMGDGTPNRVLHLAVWDGKVVGCCSSTLQTMWCPSGCGHWGLLAVDPSAQGTGVASALVAAAERRLYEAGLKQVQLEFEYQRGDPQSERLLAWYEGSCGFTGPSTRSSGFRRCRKGLRQPKPAKQTASPETQAAAEECTLFVRVTDDAAIAPAHAQSSKPRAVKRWDSPLKDCATFCSAAAIVTRLRAMLLTALAGRSTKSGRCTTR